MMVKTIKKDAPWLAPLAGYSDIAFRLVCRKYGASLAFTEMVSAKGIEYNNATTQELLRTEENDNPLVVQLFGNDPDNIRSSIHALQKQGFSAFDLNVGCSVPKVVKTGSGAALLKEPSHLYSIAKAMVEEAGEGNIGIKIRLGWNQEQENYLTVGKMLEDAGVAWITIHPRYAKQGYSGVADWDKIKQLVESVSIPIIASGDLFTAQDAYKCMTHTQAATVLFARGALSNPAIFEEYTALMQGKQYIRAKIQEVVRCHLTYLQQYMPEQRALVRLRSIFPRYYKGYSNKHILHERTLHA
nr:tRNA-dihydrouridine synthase family protein [Desulfovibrionaceae bacterium]